ncbi:hypothetical protein GUITHDRAFT_150095 [Guillardia theta CCMP2712]|uniref:Uncharacterized protein n=1 Tax=Guillardia theta (strain CCMP2712) TaxID=905079 RepID=L1K0G0_GUITC|nr:hypothetical protein GUITHDRAFT_150095 [Guillardia theta CCMP2712]EKX53935.1 hypothetical protein GUITHDRAFT_150095 [Guillardia theta CCMP2712]|eukprot:XP_005840915.1 hypothetical protein GUITHDRAFT_150095 [Guillardia theta CCMP2712]
MTSAAVDFARVATVMVDWQTEQYEKENRELQWTLFWSVYNSRKLNHWLQKLSRRLGCRCTDCQSLGAAQEDSECKTMEWLDENVRSIGMKAVPCDCLLPDCCSKSSPAKGHYCEKKFSVFVVSDSHFVHSRAGIRYGSLIDNIKTIDDPESKKLQELFRRIVYACDHTYNCWGIMGELVTDVKIMSIFVEIRQSLLKKLSVITISKEC